MLQTPSTMPTVADGHESCADADEVEAHAALLLGRLAGVADSLPSEVRAASRYLAQSMFDTRVDLRESATAAEADVGTFAEVVELVRRQGKYRAYVWDWILGGRQRLTPLAGAVDAGLNQESTASVAGTEESNSHTFVERLRKRPSRVLGRIRSIYNSWTGSVGTTSFYDKDSSPD